MSIAARVKWFLDVNRVPYEIVARPGADPTETGGSPAVPPEKIVRAVLLEDESGYLMPVLPAGRQLNLEKLRRDLERDLKPAASTDAHSLFFDCQGEAIPAAGAAYGIQTIVDDELVGVGDIYFQGGDSQDLVHMQSDTFFELIAEGKHSHFSVAS
jgi:Ala-tRNA(Pro) deacylase